MDAIPVLEVIALALAGVAAADMLRDRRATRHRIERRLRDIRDGASNERIRQRVSAI